MTLPILTLAQMLTVAYALTGGVFLAFSDFIMRALALTSGPGGVEAMQHINREVFRIVFMVLFLGLAPASLLLIGTSALTLNGTPATLFTLAGLVYLIGCFLVTILFNVPMNETLAKLDAGTATTTEYWVDAYVPRWTFWNTVRTIACTLAALLMLAGLMRL